MHFDRESAIKTIYYLINIDGKAGEEERNQMMEIINLLAPDFDPEYITKYFSECDEIIQAASEGDEWYEIIQEAIDRVIMYSSDEYELFVPTRMIVWNMLVLAYADSEYHPQEKKLIRHICRFTDMDLNVFSEMEILIKTDKAVGEELKWLNSSGRPYNEIRPLVDEIEKRQMNIKASAQALMEDEILFIEKHIEKEPSKFEKAKETVVDKSKEVADKSKEVVGAIGEKGKHVVNIVGEKGKEAVTAVGKGGSKLFANVKQKVRKEN